MARHTDSTLRNYGGGGGRRSGELPALQPSGKSWRSPWFGPVVLQAELQLRQAIPEVLDLAAQLEEADLYPAVMDLIVAVAYPEVAEQMHAFYAGRGESLQALSATDVHRLDVKAQRLGAQLHLAALRVQLRCMNDPLQHRPDTIRNVLDELGLRLAPAKPERLPKVAPVTKVPWDDPKPFFTNDSGTVLDRRSGLTWMPFQFAHAGSREWAEDYALGLQMEESDWDLPTKKQLATLCWTSGMRNEWVWLREAGRSRRYGWVDRVSGDVRQVLRSWAMKVWLVKSNAP